MRIPVSPLVFDATFFRGVGAELKRRRGLDIAQAHHNVRGFVGVKAWVWTGSADALPAWRVGAPAQSLLLRRQPWRVKRIRCSGRFTRTG